MMSSRIHKYKLTLYTGVVCANIHTIFILMKEVGGTNLEST